MGLTLGAQFLSRCVLGGATSGLYDTPQLDFLIPALTLASSSQQPFPETLFAPSRQNNVIPALRCLWSSGSRRPGMWLVPTALSSAGTASS